MARIANLTLYLSVLFFISLTGCQNTSVSKDTLKVGAMAGPETRLLEVAKNVARRTSGLSIDIVEYGTHEGLPEALSHGKVDVTFNQLPKAVNGSEQALVSMGKFFLYPTSSYSRKVKNMKALQYVDHLVARVDNKNDPRIQKLITALRSPDVLKAAGKLFNGQAVVGWEQS